jgi:hypothetical protein
MTYQETHAFCSTCRKPQLVRRQRVNHLRHLLLSILTLGFWVIGWFLAIYSAGHWECAECGARVEPENYSTGHVTWVLGMLAVTATVGLLSVGSVV